MPSDRQNEAGPESTAADFDQPTGFGDAVSGVLCLITAAAGALFIVPAWVYVPEKVAGTIDSPAVMPLLMLGLLALFGAVLLTETVRKDAVRQTHRTRRDWVRAGGMMAICALYLALILVIGLPVATGITLVAAMLYFGERRWVVVLPVAAAIPLLLWAFFAYVVQMPMPQPLLRLGVLQPGLAVEMLAFPALNEAAAA